jgi:hypothetical protein
VLAFSHTRQVGLFLKKPFVKPGGHGHWNFLSNLYLVGMGIEGFFFSTKACITGMEMSDAHRP